MCAPRLRAATAHGLRSQRDDRLSTFLPASPLRPGGRRLHACVVRGSRVSDRAWATTAPGTCSRARVRPDGRRGSRLRAPDARRGRRPSSCAKPARPPRRRRPPSLSTRARCEAPRGDRDRRERKAFSRSRRAGPGARAWWVHEMLVTPSPLTERMTLFWHNHFVSSQQKVRVARLMYRQNATLRANALGSFGDAAARASQGSGDARLPRQRAEAARARPTRISRAR